MKPVNFNGANSVLGQESDEVDTIYLHIDRTDTVGTITSCWELTDKEIQLISETKRVYIQQHTFQNPMNFLSPSINTPDELKIESN